MTVGSGASIFHGTGGARSSLTMPMLPRATAFRMMAATTPSSRHVW